MLKYSIEDIIKNNLVNGDDLNKTITNIRERTYGFQEKLQLDSVMLDMVDFSLRDFNKKIVDVSVRPVRYKYISYLEYSLIRPSNKLLFKRSGLKDKELSMYDLSENPSIFHRNFMVFIEGKLVDSVAIKPSDGEINLIINTLNGVDRIGVSDDVMNDWIERDVKGTIVFFSNSEFNPLITNREILTKNSQFLSLQDSGLIEELESDERYITFVTSNSFGYKSNLIDTTNRDKLLSFFKEVDSAEPTMERSFINIFGFKNLSDMRNISGETTMFQLPGYRMPIPVDNIMIFKNTPEGREFCRDVSLTGVFPNFYKVEGNTEGDDLSLLIFYSEQNDYGDGYFNELEGYYKIMGDGVDVLLSAPDSVRNYKTSDIEYSILDYLNSGINETLEYKLRKLNGLVEAHPDYLREFLKSQIETDEGFYIDVSQINLDERKRFDNLTEISDPTEQMLFDRGRYLFTIRNVVKNNATNVRVFIDGLAYYPDLTFTVSDYVYMYIPFELIKSDSLIEVETFYVDESVREMKFTSLTDSFDVPITENVYVYDDIHVVNLNDDRVLDKSKFTFTLNYGVETKTINGGVYKIIDTNTLTISLKDDTLLDVPLKVSIGRYQYVNEYPVTANRDRQDMDVLLKGEPEHSHLRLFVNGRLLNNSYTGIDFEGLDGYTTKVTCKVFTYNGDKIIVDYTPNTYELVLSLEAIPDNNILYLNGILDRPFDLDWYDVYVNGRRMTNRNIDRLSPYLIQFKNISSAKNVEIYTKKRMSDIITAGSNGKTVVDELWETYEPFKSNLLERDTASSDIEENVVGEAMFAYLDALTNFYQEAMLNVVGHIIPEDNQITEELIAEYPLVFDKLLKGEDVLRLGDTSWLGEEDTSVMHLNPDIEY